MKTYNREEACAKLGMLGLEAHWQADTDAIFTEYVFDGFTNALAFMLEAGISAENANHHPDWSNSYNKVKIQLSTHSAGGITDLDFALASAMHAVYMRERKS